MSFTLFSACFLDFGEKTKQQQRKANYVLVKTKETSSIFSVLSLLFLFWGKASRTTVFFMLPCGRKNSKMYFISCEYLRHAVGNK